MFLSGGRYENMGMEPMTDIHWIPIALPGGLGIMPRPRGGDLLVDEIRNWQSNGIHLAVSALEALEEAYLELEEEESLCTRYGIRFERFQVTDRSTPSDVEANYRFVEQLAGLVEGGDRVVVHCRLGIGRSGMLCAATLVALGIDSDQAFHRVASARGMQVPDTMAQVAWVRGFERWREEARG
jgi:protein-tyrosine phosphatase